MDGLAAQVAGFTLMSSAPSVSRTTRESVASSEQRQPTLNVPVVCQRAQAISEPVSVPFRVKVASSPTFLGEVSVVTSAVGGVWSTRKWHQAVYGLVSFPSVARARHAYWPPSFSRSREKTVLASGYVDHDVGTSVRLPRTRCPRAGTSSGAALPRVRWR
ncbi:hypothetical protein WKI68_25340 [Streptomyces sp. MS1.HAVA.3]|uniref:Uncharacterized protein n=1 Tax=Streptomyces caledonius TaxID=3134107 RepID=A0ABU8U922_9ACTN